MLSADVVVLKKGSLAAVPADAAKDCCASCVHGWALLATNWDETSPHSASGELDSPTAEGAIVPPDTTVIGTTRTRIDKYLVWAL